MQIITLDLGENHTIGSNYMLSSLFENWFVEIVLREKLKLNQSLLLPLNVLDECLLSHIQFEEYYARTLKGQEHLRSF